MSYDALNRMTQATHDSNGTDQYAYDPSNRMAWNKIQSSTEYVTFYGVFGEVLGRFGVSPEAGGRFAHERRRIYFGGRQILTDNEFSAGANVTDRLGSVRKGTDSYYPFGEIKTGNGDTFATYPRNATSNLHYATNRWYSNQIARFTTPDPWGPSATPGDPQSWNRYAYVQNDPVNWNDPRGLDRRSPNDRYRQCLEGGILTIRGCNELYWMGLDDESFGREMSYAPPYESGGGGGGAVTSSKSGLTYHGLSWTGAQYAALKRVEDDLVNRLRADRDCLRWLRSGANGGAVADSILANLARDSRVARRIEQAGNAAPGIVATALDLPGTSIIVNAASWFFDSRYSDHQRGWVILHELAHVAKAPGFINNDGSNVTAQESNERRLQDECGALK